MTSVAIMSSIFHKKIQSDEKVSVIIQPSSFTVAQIIVGRIITGIGNGLDTSTCPVWQSETSKAKSYGKRVICQHIFNVG